MNASEIFDEMASAGLTIDQALYITDRAVSSKTANAGVLASILAGIGGLTSGVKNTIGAGSDMLRASLPVAAAGAAAFPLVGYAAGDFAARTLDADSDDVQEIQEQELISELETNAERLRRIRELKTRRDAV